MPWSEDGLEEDAVGGACVQPVVRAGKDLPHQLRVSDVHGLAQWERLGDEDIAEGALRPPRERDGVP